MPGRLAHKERAHTDLQIQARTHDPLFYFFEVNGVNNISSIIAQNPGTVRAKKIGLLFFQPKTHFQYVFDLKYLENTHIT
jgi:hypothetical protein